MSCPLVWTHYQNGSTLDCDGKCIWCGCRQIGSGVRCLCPDKEVHTMHKLPERELPRCECGAAAIGSPIHSPWCPAA